MQLIDPTVTSPTQDNTRAPNLVTIEGRKIGLLSNGKVNADVLLRETAEIFSSKHNCQVMELRRKTNASAPAPAKIIEQLAQECDFLITANGD